VGRRKRGIAVDPRRSARRARRPNPLVSDLDAFNICRLCAFRLKRVLCLICMNNFAVASEHRRKRLKLLLDRLAQLPESPERARMLWEVRSRAVDLDTGVIPRAMVPVQAPILGPRRPAPRRRLAGLAAASVHSPPVALERRTLREPPWRNGVPDAAVGLP
jgi:hypothetical protein